MFFNGILLKKTQLFLVFHTSNAGGGKRNVKKQKMKAVLRANDECLHGSFATQDQITEAQKQKNRNE